MAYLVVACGTVWVGTILYLLVLTKRERALERELEVLRALLAEGDD